MSETVKARIEQIIQGRAVVASLRKPDAEMIAWATENNRLVRIDRMSKWGNPFAISRNESRASACLKFEEHFHSSGLKGNLNELRGKVLACWCYPLQCHGDFLAKEANQFNLEGDL